jgi:hypothetical protein
MRTPRPRTGYLPTIAIGPQRHDIDVDAGRAGQRRAGSAAARWNHAVERSCPGRRPGLPGLPATDGTAQRGPCPFGRDGRAHTDSVDRRVGTPLGALQTRAHAE